RHRVPRRLPRRDRRRCGALVSRQPRARPDDRDRRRSRRRALAEEPRVLRAVRARADRRNPPQRIDRSKYQSGAGAAAGRGGTGAREAPRRVPRRRSRGDRAARSPGDSRIRDPGRRRLPSVLPRASRSRERAGGVPPRPLPGHRDGDRAVAAADRRRGARTDVGSRAVSRPVPDRNVALELVRVTEAAAMAAARWIGRGEKESADQAAVDAMRVVLDTVAMRGTVVIGEGEKDEAPMLYNGESVGNGQGPEVDVAVDPLEGTRLTALGQPNAIAVIALAERGTM